MLRIDTGDPNPIEMSKQSYIDKYQADSRRLEILRHQADDWWQQTTNFFDVARSRAWVLTRRIDHSTHHRGQLVVYLRLLNMLQPSVYGPTADTGDLVIYTFEK